MVNIVFVLLLSQNFSENFLAREIHGFLESILNEAFEEVKTDLTKSTVLAMYYLRAETKFSVDATSFGLGAVLLQKFGEGWKPIVNASCSIFITPFMCQENYYNTTDTLSRAPTSVPDYDSQSLQEQAGSHGSMYISAPR